VLFTCFFLDLRFRIVGTEEQLDVVLTAEALFLPIQCVKLSGVQQGTLASFRDRGGASVQRSPVISGAAGGSTAVSFLPLSRHQQSGAFAYFSGALIDSKTMAPKARLVIIQRAYRAESEH
jgi:hypothetical protein